MENPPARALDSINKVKVSPDNQKISEQHHILNLPALSLQPEALYQK